MSRQQDAIEDKAVEDSNRKRSSPPDSLTPSRAHLGRHAKPGVETQDKHIMEVDTNMAAMVTPRDKTQGLSQQDTERETMIAALGQPSQSPQAQDKDLTKPTKKVKGTSTSLQQAVLAEPKNIEQEAMHTNAQAEQEETENTRQPTQDALLLSNQMKTKDKRTQEVCRPTPPQHCLCSSKLMESHTRQCGCNDTHNPTNIEWPLQ